MSTVTRVLRNAAQSGKPRPMSADHTLYHLAPTGFWKKFRDAVVVNPEISSGLPLPLKNRYPPPASRPERYATPATKASDPAFNPYYKRDVRRSYPQTTTITQTHLTSLLLSSPTLASLPAPDTKLEPANNSHSIAPSVDNSDRAVVVSSVPDLSSVLGKLPLGKAFIGGGVGTGESGESLPPMPPRALPKWIPKLGEEIPHDKHAYFPMIGFT